ncbi:MAG: ribonuclease D [Myxococcota bacterium]
MFGDTELWFVDTQEGLERAARELSKAKVIGVDTEGDSFHHYKEKTCLIQFSDIERDYMVDPLAVDDISILGDIMVDPKIVKIFHGVDYDVMCMNRDFGFEFRNLFDTMIAAQMAGHQKIGLADLINDYFGITIDKKYQRHDWAKRPLLQEHIEYARGDTHYILAIREFLIRELKEVGRLGHLTEECKILEGRRYVPKIAQEHAWLGTKRANHLDPQELNVLKHVWRYRASEAERADRPTFKVFADPILVKIAENQPETLDDLDRLFSGMHGMKRRYGKGIVSAVRAGQDDESPIPKPQKPKKPRGPKPRLTGRTAERAHEALKAWRNKLTKAHNDLSPVTVASNTVLKRIASARPTTIDELRDVQDVRNWQVNDFGEEILAVLDKVAPMGGEDNGDDGDDAPKASRPRKRRRKPKASED